MTSPQVTEDARHSLRTALIEKCWKDPNFKAQVIADPRGMYEKHTGRSFPNGFNIVIHEDDANTLHFSIPHAPSNVGELSDEELEQVAGGTDLLITVTVSVAVVAGAVTSAFVSAEATALNAGKSSPW